MTDFRAGNSDLQQVEVRETVPPGQVDHYLIAQAEPRSSGPDASGNSQGFPWMVSLFAFLLLLSFFLPYTVEQMTYAIVRGRQRAEYETAGEVLQAAPLGDLSKAYQLVAHRVGPSVVHIDVSPLLVDELQQYPQPSIRRHPSTGQGSGVVIDADGYIVTNEHVVRGAQEIRVKLSDGRVVPAEIVGVDRPTDVAVLKVNSSNLMAAEWGDSDQLQVGALVWALGSPFGLEHSVTFGILSAKHRSGIRGGQPQLGLGDTPYQDLLQTDAAVNPGNSGGPLVDSRGRVVGINTAIVGESYQGISFSVPSRVAKSIYDRIRREGTVRRGWLGVRPQDITPELADSLGLEQSRGALVTDVPPSSTDQPSPAQQAGIEPGDVIIGWNGQSVDSRAELFSQVAMTEIGSTVDVQLIRSGERLTVQVTVVERGREGRSFKQ